MITKFTRSARKHRIGKTHALYVINNNDPVITIDADGHNLSWVGTDERGVELEIVARLRVHLNHYTGKGNLYLLVLHVMPTQYRKAKS